MGVPAGVGETEGERGTAAMLEFMTQPEPAQPEQAAVAPVGAVEAGAGPGVMTWAAEGMQPAQREMPD